MLSSPDLERGGRFSSHENVGHMKVLNLPAMRPLLTLKRWDHRDAPGGIFIEPSSALPFGKAKSPGGISFPAWPSGSPWICLYDQKYSRGLCVNRVGRHQPQSRMSSNGVGVLQVRGNKAGNIGARRCWRGWPCRGRSVPGGALATPPGKMRLGPKQAIDFAAQGGILVLIRRRPTTWFVGVGVEDDEA